MYIVVVISLVGHFKMGPTRTGRRCRVSMSMRMSSMCGSDRAGVRGSDGRSVSSTLSAYCMRFDLFAVGVRVRSFSIIFKR